MIIGPHADITEENISAISEMGANALQFMPGGRMAYAAKNVCQKLLMVRRSGVPIHVVAHAPLCCYVVSDNEKTARLSRVYLRDLDNEVRLYKEQTGSNGKLKTVIHAGSLTGPAEDAFKDFCSWCNYSLKNLIVCVENDVGSKDGRKIGSVTFLADMIRKYGGEVVKLAVDTNHAWGHEEDGFDVTSMDSWDSISDILKVIHLNGTPSECERYCHRDRHSETLLEDSCGNEVWLKKLATRYEGIPYILERNDLALGSKDISWLRGQR